MVGKVTEYSTRQTQAELSRTWGAFLESPVTFRALEADLFFPCLHSRSKFQ